ncbi:serine protease [Bradyrhizobium sp. RT5a]|uniref:S1 family peptidase n=1 Tax=unclassified Bradyrhizobium TaxID=2631580 RepID=UPI003399F5AB
MTGVGKAVEHVSAAFAIVSDLPWPKLLYSAVLLVLAAILLGEVTRIWTSRQVYIGSFKYFVDGKDDEARAQSVRALILHHNRSLAERFRLEVARRTRLRDAAKAQPKEAENTWLPRGGVAINDPASAFSNVELTVQGINFTQIMSALRRSVSPPNEITGTLGRTGQNVTAVVAWPQAPQRSDGLVEPADAFHVEGERDDSDLAFNIACGLIWTEAVAQPASKLGGVDRLSFCAWARAWVAMASVRARREAQYPLTDIDIATLARARETVTAIIDQKIGFPEAYQLRADIIGLLPHPSDEDKALRVADQLAVEGRSNVLTETDILTTTLISESRPVYDFTDGKLTGPSSELWDRVVEDGRTKIEAAAASVGYLRGGRPTGVPFDGTGFVIGRDLIATADFILRALTDAKEGPIDGPTIEFVLADNIGDPASRVFRVTEVAAILPGDDKSNIAILRVPGLTGAGQRPIAVSDNPKREDGALIGVIGYPAFDGRVPSDFMAILFRNTFGRKRLMAGRLTSKSERQAGDIAHDASTIGGVGGGPILDMKTGEAIGVHFGGSFDATGKSNFGMSLTAWTQEVRSKLK